MTDPMFLRLSDALRTAFGTRAAAVAAEQHRLAVAAGDAAVAARWAALAAALAKPAAPLE